jgi:hypothetical protein
MKRNGATSRTSTASSRPRSGHGPRRAQYGEAGLIFTDRPFRSSSTIIVEKAITWRDRG